MDRKLHFLESFNATGSDGTTYKVCGYEHMVRDESLADGLEHWEPTGEIEYRLDDGARVEAHLDGSMRIESSGVELKRSKKKRTRSDGRDVRYTLRNMPAGLGSIEAAGELLPARVLLSDVAR